MLPRQPVLIIVQNLPVPLDRRLWLECQALRDSAESSDVATIARTHPVTLEPNQLDRAIGARRRQLTMVISPGQSPLEVLWHKRRGRHAGPVGSVTVSRLPTTYRLRAGLPRMPVGWVTAYLREVMVRDGSEVIAITVYNASSFWPVNYPFLPASAGESSFHRRLRQEAAGGRSPDHYRPDPDAVPERSGPECGCGQYAKCRFDTRQRDEHGA